MKTILRSLLLLIGLALGSSTASASLLFNNYVPFANSGPDTRTFGTEFTVGAQSLSITRLGVLQGTGLLFETEVGIWRVADETLLGSAVVPQTGAALVDGWLFVDVTPFTLAANATYRIGASGGSDMGWGGTFQAGTGVASVNGSAWSIDWNFMYPSMYVGVDEDPWVSFRANAEIVPVPEPAEWTMLIAGLLVLGFIARRRRPGLA